MTLRDLVAWSLAGSATARRTAVLAAASSSQLAHAPDGLELLLDYVGRSGQLPSAAQLRARADELLASATRHGLEPLGWPDPDYPSLLRAIPDAPPILWVKGQRAAMLQAGLAIVGSRAASPYGLEVAERLGRELAAAGLTIVSGLARGCDAAAHAGALAAGGLTVAVLGCGPDRIYPAEHTGLAERIVDGGGAVVSELPPGEPPLAGHFPRRNRIISGLSRAVVVVEASDQSGSLITAGCALEQGRHVLAVPGNVLGPRSRGCHGLLRDGARLVESAADVLEELGLPPVAAAPVGRDVVEIQIAPGEALTVDDLVSRTGRSAAELLSELAGLELAGRVRRVAGGRFVRVCR